MHSKEMTRLSLSPTESQCLTEVSSFLSSLLPVQNNNEVDPVQIVHIKRLKSAQQYVLLLTVKLQFTPTGTPLGKMDTKLADMENKQGNRKMVLRIWKNGARWWNLNLKSFFHLDNDERGERESEKNGYINDSLTLCHDLAKAEAAGYIVAKKALEHYTKLCGQRGREHETCLDPFLETKVCIPTLIHFQKGDLDKISSENALPWALFTYVGEDSNSLINATKDEHQEWIMCDKFIDDMVKIRHEFGFDEPHPRHGRVNIEQALEYAMHVMDTIIIPLHTAFFDCYYNMMDNGDKEDNLSSPAVTIQHPLLQQHESDLYLVNYFMYRYDMDRRNTLTSTSTEDKACRYKNMVDIYSDIMSHLKKKIIITSTKASVDQSETLNESKFLKFKVFLNMLDKCVIALQEESKAINSEGLAYLPGVLCHLDLQPQNMILCRDKNNTSGDVYEIPKIFSVLDWEESCFADPRFELLLLCRKVVANRNQADALWKRYENVMLNRFDKLSKIDNTKSMLGSIEPWLKLETVHSVITLFMQGMDLGGRSPWEGSDELWKKILREVERLVNLGWEFCNEVLDIHYA